jgi:hypothetical protein
MKMEEKQASKEKGVVQKICVVKKSVKAPKNLLDVRSDGSEDGHVEGDPQLSRKTWASAAHRNNSFVNCMSLSQDFLF